MQERLIAARRLALVIALASAAPGALAVALGDVEVRSALGEALDARIPLTPSPGEIVDATCFSLARAAEPGVPALIEGLVTIERAAGAQALRVQSAAPVLEPAVMLRLRVACPGQPGEALRQYAVLLDPRPGLKVATSLPAVAALQARGGETLDSLAAKVFPRDRAARTRYIVALREANPALSLLPARDPIPEGVEVALPDLRTYAASSRVMPDARAESAVVAAAPREGAPPARRARAPRSETPQRTRAAAPAPDEARSAPRRAEGGFVLKLSSADLDVNRSREVDDRARAQLRERHMVLDSDDQVAAILAMRNSLRQLEARVNELQLKLAAMPESLARASASPAQSASLPAPAATPTAAAPVAAATPAAAARTPAPAPAAAEPAPRPPPAPPPAVADKAPAPQPAPAKEATKPGGPGVAKAASTWPPRWMGEMATRQMLWALVALFVLLTVWLAWRLWSRHRAARDDWAYEIAEPAEELEPQAGLEDESRRGAPSAAELRARVPENASELRRRYIEERFPEIAAGSIVPEDPASVIKGARLFYEDGALPRAVELLRFVIEHDPDEVRPWLALFEIYRLERLTGEFAELATRFRERHGETPHWPKVQFIGREIDPGNELYRDASFNALETIGPSSARRMAAAAFDPIAENWLNVPMDFQNEVLANELRRSLMSRASLGEQDLVPNPMPALRHAEPITVA